ncbi:hypothetical protein DR999_PMT22780 [Platysternon megacephalum]|uniref:Uncharacterized protein n=1 Tax=Platysternon megacephalum TaxID=55544 RepID=A0A4D9DGP0_9SAUR|nr:hypothetical protein DR999_PMT22780 [Platysternon megacephalum]
MWEDAETPASHPDSVLLPLTVGWEQLEQGSPSTAPLTHGTSLGLCLLHLAELIMLSLGRGEEEERGKGTQKEEAYCGSVQRIIHEKVPSPQTGDGMKWRTPPPAAPKFGFQIQVSNR